VRKSDRIELNFSRFRAYNARSARQHFRVMRFLAAPAPPDASAQKIIQLAQERYDAYDLNGAQYYYQVLLERYGSDPEYMLNAKYEMAFIEYKKGNTGKSDSRLQGSYRALRCAGRADALTDLESALRKTARQADGREIDISALNLV